VGGLERYKSSLVSTSKRVQLFSQESGAGRKGVRGRCVVRGTWVDGKDVNVHWPVQRKGATIFSDNSMNCYPYVSDEIQDM